MKRQGWAPDDLTGEVLGSHYRVGERLGAGAMGVVYRVHHLLLGADFAAKVMAPALVRDAAARQRFLREAEGLVRIHSPHVVAVRHFGEQDGLLYLIMDVCEGETLEALIAREGPLGWQRAVPIALQILMALDAAHWEGVVHRDLKPANILISPEDPRRAGGMRVRVVDFGLAHVASRATLATVQASAKAMGTPDVVGTVAYMSPEQVRGDTDVDGRSDLFSLGAILYEMLGGRSPFATTSPLSTMLGILEQGTTPLPREGPHGVPPGVMGVIERAMEKDRERRPPTAAAMAEALRTGTGGESPRKDARRPPRARTRKARLLVAALMLAGGAALVVATDRAPYRPSAADATDRAAAQAAFLDGRFTETIAACSRIAVRAQDTLEDRLLRARALVDLEDPAAGEALDALDREAGLQDTVAVERARGADYEGLEAQEVALAGLDRAVAAHPHPDLLFRRVLTLHRLLVALASTGSPAEAAERLLTQLTRDSEALAGDPRHGVAAALTAWHRGEPDLALRAAEASAQAQLRLAEAPALCAWICVTRGEREPLPHHVASSRRWFERAQAHIVESIARARRDPVYQLQGRDLVRHWRLSCLIKNDLGDTEGASADYGNEVVHRNPTSRRDVIAGAQYLQWAGRYEAALALYARARALGLEDLAFHGEGFCHLQLGRIRADAGDVAGALEEYDEAIRHYREGENRVPDPHILRAYRAEAWLAKARVARDDAAAASLAKAREDLDSLAAQGEAHQPEVLFRRWEYHELCGDHVAALEDIRAALAADRHATAAYYRRLAYSCIVNAGDPDAAALLDEALDAAEGAAQWDPQRAELACLLQGDAHQALAQRAPGGEDRARHVAAARAAYARAAELSHLDPRTRAEAQLRLAASCLAASDVEAALRCAEDALRLRAIAPEGQGSHLLTHDSYLRSPLAAYHERLAAAYAAAGREAEAAAEQGVARALR